ncbi:hypothetical protein BFJ72_g13768 [Fusarium proliferatum]|uniref:AttH domain-containing protein n=1 Tax=Gibberella intermedia TaxID=948311 RepID=A0A420SAS0_GIBIN|nr:hypothetical protein BFJ72_g13768 [Fusarium proliferatum]
MYLASILSSALIVASVARSNPSGQSCVTGVELPFKLIDGHTHIETVSVKGGLDLPKLTPGVNASTWDWWYFDAVSATDNAAISVVLYNMAPNSLSIPYPGGPLFIAVRVTFKNGTSIDKSTVPNLGADFQISDRGLASQWRGNTSLHTFTGSSLNVPNPIYTLSINDPGRGVVGSFQLKSVAPPHYPCHLNRPGVSEQLFPNIWWANAVPDAEAVVDLVIDGESFHLRGNGYHDKNWGSGSLEAITKTWYWGHGRVGPYSLVWFDAVDKSGKEYFSSWITKGDKVLTQSCACHSVTVRPWGKNSQYPPIPGLAGPSGFNIRYDMGNGKAFTANFTHGATQLDTANYQRFTGPITGGIEGKKKHKGMALCEQFKY